jgi:hypothetical protein
LTRETPPGADRLAQIVFALLVLACFAAFFVTQRLKHTPTAVQLFKLTPVFSPTPTGHVKEERISFKLANAEKVTVTIVDAAGDTVATLAHDRPVARYKQFKLRWNGHSDRAGSDELAPAGENSVHVHLLKQRRWVYSPRSFILVRR